MVKEESEGIQVQCGAEEMAPLGIRYLNHVHRSKLQGIDDNLMVSRFGKRQHRESMPAGREALRRHQKMNGVTDKGERPRVASPSSTFSLQGNSRGHQQTYRLDD